ncbi:unnamed protein product, partial [Rotaria magnacalcarata]
MSISRPKRRLHLEYKRNWRRSILDKDLQQILSTSADIETTSIEEEVATHHFFNDHISTSYDLTNSDTYNGSGGLYESNKYTDDESEESTEYIESFIDEINSNNNDVETPLYPGSAISIRDACDRLIHLVNLLGLDKAKTCLLLKELRSFFPLGCRLPRTIFTLFKMTNNDYRSEVSVRCVECGQVLVKYIIKCLTLRASATSQSFYIQMEHLLLRRALKKSIWPVQATIAEIPIPLRDWKSAVMVFGIWLASSKPPRDHLLKPITIQLQKLMESKILLKQANVGSHLWYNVRVQQAIFDLPARAHLLNIVQYNGYDGCGDC